jgi:Carboxypeptidase regulatory-like domain
MSGVFVMVRESIGKLGFLLLIAILSSPSLHAQQLRGGISGVATDEQSAAVGGVRVIVTDQETGVQQNTVTGDTGAYRVPAEPGIYTVEFRKESFATHKAENVEVQSARDTTINAQLKVGTTATEIAVTINGMELDRVSPTVRLNLPGKLIDEIPMPTSTLVPAGSRNFARYALFTPGIARVLFQNETSANGHRGRENNYLLDGSDNNDQTVTLPALFIPPEAIQEVDVQAATFSAEYGRNIGAQINVVTKRGTNTYHGQLWEFYRGNALEPLALTDWIALRQRTPNLAEEDADNPRLVDNQFGGAFGGPIVKNKTFFFGMAQGNLLRTGPRGATATGVTIPTAAGYAALLSAPLRSGQSAGSRQAMLDALSFLPDVHSTISNYASTSTTTVNGTPIEMGRINPLIPTRQNLWYSALRVDHQLSQNDRLTFRSHIDRRVSPLSGGNLAFGERFAADTKYFAQNHFIGYTKNIGSNFINEARVSYSRLYPSSEERDPRTPTITIANNFQIGGNSNYPQDRLEQTWQFQNVSTYVMSRHSLKFGLDLARTELVSNNGTHLKGTWVFGTTAANAMQDFMNNQAATLNFLLAAPLTYEFHQLRQAYFLQDDFKLRRNFVANIGLRYETSSAPLGFFGATTTEVLNAMVPGPVQRDKNNWGPRVGFAYSPEFDSGLLGSLFGNGKSSIRGGFGIGYDVLFYSLLAFTANNYPRNDLQTYSGANAPALDQFPILPGRLTTPTLNATSGFVNVPSDAQNPTSNYWSLSIQRQIHPDFTLEIGYNGNRSYHLIRQSQVNPQVLSAAQAASVIANCTFANVSTNPNCQDPAPPRLNPSWGSRQTLETTGTASYNSVYLQVNARTHFGLRLGANYTWSANLSDSEEFSNDGATSTDGGLSGSSPQVPQDFFNRRNEWSRSVFDRPHRVAFHYSYEIPWFRSSPVALEKVFKGWQVSGFTELQSGQPFTIKIGVDAVGNGVTTSARPDYNPGGILIPDPTTGNLRTFVIPLDGTGIVTAPHVTNPATGVITFLRNSMPTGGTLGRNTFRGPGYANSNMSVMKRVTLPEDRQVQIRADFINVFNHDNFPNPDNNMTNAFLATPTFGKQIYRPLTDARQVILGVKLAF